MKRKWVIALFIFFLVMPVLRPMNACAGGAGGEPLMSDSVGWGIVGAMVLVGMYAVYKMKQEPPAAQEKLKEKDKEKEKADSRTETLVSERVMPNGDVIVAKW